MGRFFVNFYILKYVSNFKMLFCELQIFPVLSIGVCVEYIMTECSRFGELTL